MGFLAPLLLLAASALVVPVLVHLVRREDPRVRNFPALRYLARSVEERSRTTRLHQLLLLALRMAIVILIVLGASRLILPLGDGEHPPAALVLVIDNGVHSGAIVEGERVLDRLVDRGREILETLGPLDRIWIVKGGEPWGPALPMSRSEAREALAALEPVGTVAHLPELLDRARALLAPAPETTAHIVVLATLAEATVGDAPTDGPGDGGARHRTLVQGPGVDLPPNRGIGRIRIGGGLPPRAGESSGVEVQVEGEGRAGLPVRLLLAGELAAAGRTDDEGRVTLDLPPRPEGWLEGTIELEPDALRADDRRAIAVAIGTPPLVGISGIAGSHLQAALETLEAAGRIRLEAAGSGSSPDIMFHVAGAAEGWTALEQPEPTHVILAPDDPARLPAVNRLLESSDIPWRMVPTGATDRTPLAAAPGYPSALEGLEVSRRIRLEPVRPLEAQVHVRRDDGSPWLVRTRAGDSPEASHVVLLAGTLRPEESELPLSAAMIPFLDRLLTPGPFTAGDAGGAGGHPAGLPLPLPSGASAVRRPDGTLVRTDGTSRLADTGLPGRYVVLDADGNPIRPVAVHVPAEAVSGSRSLPIDEVAAALGAEAAGDSDRWAREVLRDRRGREAAGILALLALALLFVEGWLASRFDPGSRPAQRRPARHAAS